MGSNRSIPGASPRGGADDSDGTQWIVMADLVVSGHHPLVP
jgi:hypothetical protein